MSAREIFNPFPGLRAFEEDEDYLFFGREKQIDDLLRKLRTSHFIAVIGASGSGKSSLVKCGLLPALHSGYMAKAGSNWKVAVLRPGDDPLGNLAKTLAKPGVIYESPEMEVTYASIIEATLRRSNLGLIEAVRQSSLNELDNMLIVVDQFEELFRFNRYEKNEHAEKRDSLSFVDLLLNACKQVELPIYVVLTMRSDFIGECTVFQGLAEAINQSQYLVPRMSREERKEAITGPIAVGGSTITPRLLTHLLNDVGESPDQLPILQHALLRTWRYWEVMREDGEPLDLNHYMAIGTMTQALSQHAEEAFHELKSERSTKITEIIFKAITEKGEERQGIRRPTKLKEICNISGATLAEVTEVINTFRKEGRSFLMPPQEVSLTADSIIDISHESLMRIWGRLIKWVEEETYSAEIYKRLAEAAALYQEAKSGLWRNPELQFALKWYEENKPNRFWAQRYDPSFERAIGFLKESKRQEEFEALQKEKQEKLKIKRMRFFAIILGAAAFVSLLLLIIVMNLQARSKQSAALAEEKAKEAKDQKVIAEFEKKEAELQSKEALRQRQEADMQKRIAEEQGTLAVQHASEAMLQKKLALEARDEAELQKREALDQKNKAEFLQERAETSEQRMNRLRMVSLSNALAFQSLREYKNNNIELSTLLALHAYRFNINNGGEELNPEIYQALAQVTNNRLIFAGHEDAVHSVSISADGQKIISGSSDKTVRVWDISDPQKSPQIFPGNNAAIRCVANSKDSKYMIAGDVGGKILIWELADKRQHAPFIVDLYKGGGVSALAINANSNFLAAGGADGMITLLRLNDLKASPTVLDTLPGKISDLVITSDGASLAAVYEHDVTLIYNLRNLNTKPVTLSMKNSKLMSVDVSPDGRYLAAGGRDGRVFIWRIKNRHELLLTLTGHNSGVTDLEFSPDDSLLATASLDRTIRLWRYKNAEREPVILSGHNGWVRSLAFNPLGNTLISASEDRTIRSWTPSIKFLVKEACGKVTRNLTLQEWNSCIGNNVNYEEPCN